MKNTNIRIARELNRIAWRLVVADEQKKRFEEAKKIFNREEKTLLNKINNYFKKQGLRCYYALLPDIYFSDGYRKRLKFYAVGDNKGREWWEWIRNVIDMDTNNLVFKYESNPEICLKKSYRPESHRGQVVNLDAIGRNGF